MDGRKGFGDALIGGETVGRGLNGGSVNSSSSGTSGSRVGIGFCCSLGGTNVG